MQGRTRGARRPHLAPDDTNPALGRRAATWVRVVRRQAIICARDADASLRNVQDYVGHNDPCTTRRYDHSHDSIDRNAV